MVRYPKLFKYVAIVFRSLFANLQKKAKVQHMSNIIQCSEQILQLQRNARTNVSLICDAHVVTENKMTM